MAQQEQWPAELWASLNRETGVVLVETYKPLHDPNRNLRRYLPASPSSSVSSDLQQTLNEFDAWLSFRGEFHEVLTALRKAFGTDSSGHRAVLATQPTPGLLLGKLEAEVKRQTLLALESAPAEGASEAEESEHDVRFEFVARLQALIDSEGVTAASQPHTDTGEGGKR